MMIFVCDVFSGASRNTFPLACGLGLGLARTNPGTDNQRRLTIGSSNRFEFPPGFDVKQAAVRLEGDNVIRTQPVRTPQTDVCLLRLSKAGPISAGLQAMKLTLKEKPRRRESGARLHAQSGRRVRTATVAAACVIRLPASRRFAFRHMGCHRVHQSRGQAIVRLEAQLFQARTDAFHLFRFDAGFDDGRDERSEPRRR